MNRELPDYVTGYPKLLTYLAFRSSEYFTKKLSRALVDAVNVLMSKEEI